MDNKGIMYGLITKRKAVLAIVFILFIIGGLCYYIVPKQQFPVIQLPVVIITTIYPGAAPSDIEELITDKIEDVCMEAEGFNDVKSSSYNGVSVVRMMFAKNLTDEQLKDDIDSLRTKIDDLRKNELPEGITSLTFNDNAFQTCGLILAFTGDNRSNAELTQRAEALEDKIQGTKGVIRTDVEGEQSEQVKITVDSSKLSHTNVSLTELANMIAYQNSIIPVGTMKFKDNEIYVNSSGKFKDIDEIKDIIISGNASTGAVVKLRDVADVALTVDDESKIYNYNGKDSVIVSVYFDESVNVLTVSETVKKITEDYKEALPPDISVDTVVDLADEVNSSINDFVINLIESVVIVLVIVMIGMSVRNGSIVAFVIPFTIFLTFIAMAALDIDIQFVSLASLIIALGMLVDNAIVVSDSIQTRIDAGEDRMSACIKGTKEVALPVLSSMLTTVFIFCVFYSLPGTMKRFVFSLPTIVIAALVFSYAVSMIVTPITCYMFMRPSRKKVEKNGIVRRFFSSLLKAGLKFRLLTLIISAICVGFGVWLLSTRDLQLLPNSDKMMLDIDIQTDNLFDFDRTKRAVDAVEKIIAEEEPIEYYLASTGGRVPKYDFTTMASTDAANSGSFLLKLGNLGDMNKTEYCEYLENKLKIVSSAKITVKEIGIVPKQSELLEFYVCGSDIPTLNETARKASEILRAKGDVRDVYTDTEIKGYNYYIDMKNASLNSTGLTKGQVQNELNIAVMGRTVTTFRKNNKEYPVVLKTETNNISDLKNLEIKSTVLSGKYKLSQIADISYIPDYEKITHYNGERCITVSAIPQGSKSAVALMRAAMGDINGVLERGITVTYEGDYDMFAQVMSSLLQGGVLGFLAIVLILYLQFYSAKRVFIILMTIPFSIIGAAIGLCAFGENLSMFAILGIISLIGVVVNNAIVLVDYIDGELAEGVSVSDACRTAVDKRFRPIMLSTTTTVLGLIPLALGGNIIFKGLSIAFMCGLTTSLVFTLVVIPVIYRIIIKDAVKTTE